VNRYTGSRFNILTMQRRNKKSFRLFLLFAFAPVLAEAKSGRPLRAARRED
jgi:hypothetical protein